MRHSKEKQWEIVISLLFKLVELVVLSVLLICRCIPIKEIAPFKTQVNIFNSFIYLYVDKFHVECVVHLLSPE